MPKTVRDLKQWHQTMTEFKNFAVKNDAEFQFNVLPDGKEIINVRLFYRPVKKGESINVSQSCETRN